MIKHSLEFRYNKLTIHDIQQIIDQARDRGALENAEVFWSLAGYGTDDLAIRIYWSEE